MSRIDYLELALSSIEDIFVNTSMGDEKILECMKALRANIDLKIRSLNEDLSGGDE